MIADYRRRMRHVGKKTLPLLPESTGFFFRNGCRLPQIQSSFPFFLYLFCPSPTDTEVSLLAFNPVAGSFRELFSCVFLFLFLWFCLFLVPYPLRKVIFFCLSRILSFNVWQVTVYLFFAVWTHTFTFSSPERRSLGCQNIGWKSSQPCWLQKTKQCKRFLVFLLLRCLDQPLSIYQPQVPQAHEWLVVA